MIKTQPRAAVPHLLLLLLCCTAGRAQEVQRFSDPLLPDRSIAAMHLKEGFQIELVAAEPLISSPVAIDWGPDGKLWVVEMYDYPNGLENRGKPGGRVRVLEDPDGSGHYTKSTVFLDGLNMPTGITLWRKGVIITAAPDILYAEDTDGDGKADVKTVLYTGFKPGNPQLRVNGLRWGLDGWLYCANGWSGGNPKSIKTGQSVALDGRDLRIKPDEGLIELVSGQSEFGRERDDWGNWFGCDNSHPLFHFVLEDRCLRRNPHLAAPDPRVQVIVPANPPVFPVSRPQKRYYTDAAGHFTSACGMALYRDNLLFPFSDHEQHYFVCEPANNLIHHEIVQESGYTFTAVRPSDEQDREFLASEDQWFRPVMVRTGPDAALWVVDMYRYMIEHPDWLPEQGKRELAPFYREGENRGRIYRIFPKGQRPRPIPRIEKLSTLDLARAMDSSNGTLRDLIHKMLIWRADPAAVQPLQRLAGEAPDPRVRIQALHALFQLGDPGPQLLESALTSKDVHVRREALRIAESRLATDPTLLERFLKEGETAPVEQLQLALSLGECHDAAAGEALGKLAVRGANDPLFTAPVLSSATTHLDAIVKAVRESNDPLAQPLHGELVRLTLAMDQPRLLALLLHPALEPGQKYSPAQQVAVREFLDQAGAARKTIDELSHDPAMGPELEKLPAIYESARRTAADPSLSPDDRVAAIELLGRESTKRDRELEILSGLLASNNPPQLQTAAAHALSRIDSPTVPQILLKNWPTQSPHVRGVVIDVLLAREDWTRELLHRIESGAIGKPDIDPARRDRLVKHGPQATRPLAQKLLGAIESGRQRVIDQYRDALTLSGDAGRGQALFQQNCAVCHRKGGAGADVGPNLDSVLTWQSEALLTAILDPSRQVEPQYLAYTLTLNDGQALYGIITSETAGGITVKGLDGKAAVLPRSAIRSVAGTGKSLMPDGLETPLDKQAMADLIRFLQSTPQRR